MQISAGRDVFVLPHGDEYLLYAPLAGRVVHTNADCIAQIQEYVRSGDASAVDRSVAETLGGLAWLESAHSPQAPPVDRPFRPTRTTLFLTNRCNLRCRYCYASAGEFSGHDMPSELYRAAIDLVAANNAQSKEPLHIGFHGGGEPTSAWDALMDVVEYAKAAEADLKRGGESTRVRFSLATNGVMSAEKRAYIGKTFDSVTLSFDGPAEVQNAQRPCADGSGSFDKVMAFVESLRGTKVTFAIRATITATNVARMPEMVEFFAKEVCPGTRCQKLQFEPIYFRGRARGCDDDFPSPESFIEHFIRAMDVARKHNVELGYSAARVKDCRVSFCGCAFDPFYITHEGDVTGCYEICDRQNPLAKTFHFGRYSQERKTFEIDTERLAKLRAMTVSNKPQCQRCFAKWTCSGDCPVKGTGFGGGSGDGKPRCVITQAITRELLARAVEERPRADKERIAS